MKAVDSTTMRKLDRRAIEETGIPGETLMERAGRGLADVVERILHLRSEQTDRPVYMAAGHGNNGGDVFAAARHLLDRGFSVQVDLAGKLSDVRGDALDHLRRLQACGVGVQERSSPEAWSFPASDALAPLAAVDGILGTGISGPPHEPAASAIGCINAMGRNCPVIAVDMPSGLNADNGVPAATTVTADVTVTMGLPKIGLLAPRATDFVGAVEVIDIGIPAAFVEPLPSGAAELITPRDLRSLFSPRRHTAHKGDFGHVLLLGGARGFCGAIAMAAAAALRAGAGLASALVPESVAAVVATMVPEAMVHPGHETPSGSLDARALEESPLDLSVFDAVLVGPGMTSHPQTQALTAHLLEHCRVPLLMDADALNVYAADSGETARAHGPLIMTPHPGEMARLLGCTTADVQADRAGAVACLCRLTRGTVVLKGAGTLVADDNGVPHINMTGNAGMATGGTGDVLGGIIAGLAAQRIPPADAARAGVYVHGRAGDNAAWRLSQAGMLARDLLTEVPCVLRELTGR